MTHATHLGAAAAALEQSLGCQRHLAARYLVGNAAAALEVAQRHDLAERLVAACGTVGWPDMLAVQDVLQELDNATA